jgi:hypothetical protein
MSQSLVLQGVITKISEVQQGESKAGKSWKKMGFAMETLGEYNKTVYFTVFGEEKVNNFQKYNKVGQEVEVSFNAESREYNERFYTDLQAWKVYVQTSSSEFASQEETYHEVVSGEQKQAADDGMPF